MYDELINGYNYMNYPYILNNRNKYLHRDMHTENVPKEVLDMIKDIISLENDTLKFYDYLLALTVDPADRKMIERMKDDISHYNEILRKLYLELAGVALPNNKDITESELNLTYMRALEEGLAEVLDNIEKYRKILSEMTDRQRYNMVMEIIMSEIRRSANFNYLISKNMIRNK